jgi:hypothetical protein
VAWRRSTMGRRCGGAVAFDHHQRSSGGRQRSEMNPWALGGGGEYGAWSIGNGIGETTRAGDKEMGPKHFFSLSSGNCE